MTQSITTNDTICAISTPPGVGGIAIARISGPKAIETVDSIWKGRSLNDVATHTAHLGTVIGKEGMPLDQAVATVFRAPHSFTGEEVVEIAVHGSRFVQRELIEILISAGARLADPGEFTRRAFTAGRMDLAEAEAVADVIASNSRAAHRIAMSQMRGDYSRKLASLRQNLVELSSLLELELDFSEEDVEFASRSRLREIASGIHNEVTRLSHSFASGAAIKNGIPVAITGATNAGKSSLLNALLDDDRAIVSEIHGTTRDIVEDTLELGDFLFRFMDTAGLRDTSDAIERIGIERSRKAIAKARIVIAVTDVTEPLDTSILQEAAAITTRPDTPGYLILAINKCDQAISTASHREMAHKLLEKVEADGHAWIVEISAKDGSGLDHLREFLQTAARNDLGDADEDILVTNARHAQALKQAAESTARILDGMDANLPGDLIAQDVRETIHHLNSITGAITTTEILTTIFSRFCIGK